LLASILFLIIPFTQLLTGDEPEIVTYREVLTLPPPPPIAPPAQAIELPKTTPPPPSFEPPIDAIDPNPLTLSLNPGIGDAMAMGINTHGFKIQVDAIGDIQQIFTFADLPTAPRILNTPRITFPRKLIRQNITEGKVVVLIEINEQGQATVLKTISSTHPSLAPMAEGIVQQARFSVSKVDGVPVKVQGKWPLYLKAPHK